MEQIVFKKNWKQGKVGDGMDRHLEFEEIVSYIKCRDLSDESVRLAQRINPHILQCKECKRMYDAILEFYEVAFNDSLDTNFFDNVENIKTLVKFKVEEKVNIVLDYMTNMLYRYEYPMALGARGDSKEASKLRSEIVDEDNGLNTIVINNGMCEVSIDREDCGNMAPIILVMNKDGELVFSGVMKENEDVFYASMPLVSDEYRVFVSIEGSV